MVELNRAVAVGFAEGPQAGLELLSPLLRDAALERYQPLHAAHAELLKRAGDREGAVRAYKMAIELSANAVERAELERRLQDRHRLTAAARERTSFGIVPVSEQGCPNRAVGAASEE